MGLVSMCLLFYKTYKVNMSKENINYELQKIMLHTEDLKKTLKEMEVYNDLLKWVATQPHTFTTIMNG